MASGGSRGRTLQLAPCSSQVSPLIPSPWCVAVCNGLDLRVAVGFGDAHKVMLSCDAAAETAAQPVSVSTVVGAQDGLLGVGCFALVLWCALNAA